MIESRPSITRHRFSPAVRRAVQACYTLDNWHGPLEILEHWSFIVLAAFASIVAWERLPLVASIPVLALAVFVIGGRQRALAGVLHQACHGTLMTNLRTGRILAATLGGYPVLQSLSGYRASHVRNHHGHFGDPDRDPDYQFFLRAGLYRESSGPGSFRRHLAGSLSPWTTLRYIGFLFRHRILNPHERRGETLVRLMLYALIIVAAAQWNALWIVLVYWLLPLVTTQVWIGSFAELLEHYPLMQRVPATDVRMSHNRDFGWMWNLVLGEKRGEGYHLVHHLFPQVPLWALHRVHQILLTDPEYARVLMPRTPLEALRAIEASLPRHA